jgi:hypothetical protein
MRFSNPPHRKAHVSYGDVLCFVDAYKKKFEGLNYWEKKAVLRLQHTAIAQDIIDHINNVVITIIIHNNIRSDGTIYRHDFSPAEEISCFHKGVLHRITNARWQLEGRTKQIALSWVRICLNANNEPVFRYRDMETKYAARLVAENGDVTILGDISLFAPTYEDKLESAAFKQTVKRLFLFEESYAPNGDGDNTEAPEEEDT